MSTTSEQETYFLGIMPLRAAFMLQFIDTQKIVYVEGVDI